VLCMSQVWELCRPMVEQEERGNETQPEVAAPSKAQMNEFAEKFE
jgi:hypothetical protein